MDFVEGDSEEKVVDVVSAKVRVAVGGLHFEDALAKLEDGDIKGAASEVVDRDEAFLFSIESIRECRCRGFVDQAQNFKTSHATRVLGGLPLRVIEVRGNCNDGLCYG